MADAKTSDLSVWPTLLIVIAAIVTSDIAAQHMQRNAAFGVGGCTIVVLAVARVRWDLRREWWFWGALCIGALLQLPLIFFMPWANPYLTGIGAMAFVIPGFLMALGCVFLAEKFIPRRSAQK